MVKGKLVFTKVIQDSQDFGSDDEHMVSRVFFDLEVRGEIHRGLYVDVKQTVGTDYETAPRSRGASRPHFNSANQDSGRIFP